GFRRGLPRRRRHPRETNLRSGAEGRDACREPTGKGALWPSLRGRAQYFRRRARSWDVLRDVVEARERGADRAQAGPAVERRGAATMTGPPEAVSLKAWSPFAIATATKRIEAWCSSRTGASARSCAWTRPSRRPTR